MSYNFVVLQIDQLKQELSKKESELLALQTKLETLSNQNSDCKQHIEVLKESLTAKEQRAAILQTEVRCCLRIPDSRHWVDRKCLTWTTFFRRFLIQTLGARVILYIRYLGDFGKVRPIAHIIDYITLPVGLLKVFYKHMDIYAEKKFLTPM